MSERPQVPEAETEAARRQLLTLAEAVLDTGPNLLDGDRVESMRLILRALAAVEAEERKLSAEFEQRYPESYWNADVAHLVAVAVDAEINERSVDEYAPYSVVAEGYLAFAAAVLATDHASNLRGALDAELYTYSAAAALTNMDVYQPPKPADPPELDKPAT